MDRVRRACRVALAAVVVGYPLLLRAAIPPEPIGELLPRATLIVVAQVATVVSTDPQGPATPRPPGWVGGSQGLPKQVVVLKVERVLRGTLSAADKTRGLNVTKPAGEYLLRAANRGPFLLERQGQAWVILGRYGPDNYRVQEVEEALKEAARD